MLTRKEICNIYALDLGTTKFVISCLRPTFDQSSLQKYKIEYVSVPAMGMKNGMLKEFDLVQQALENLLKQAEKEFKCDIRKVVVGVAGCHLRGLIKRTSVQIDNEQVRFKDLDNIVNKVEEEFYNEKISLNTELLHTVPLEYMVDNNDRINNPLNLSGKKLSAEFNLIYSNSEYMQNLVRVINNVGLQVKTLYSEPFASASVCVPDTHKLIGCALCDIGGGTTDGIVFKEGKPIFIYSIDIAGELFTSDLAIGLNTTHFEADRIKKEYGISNNMDTDFNFKNINNQLNSTNTKLVTHIISSRSLELSQELAKHFKKFKGTLGAGILLTGGGANMKGLDSFFEQKLKIHTQVSTPSLFIDNKNNKKTQQNINKKSHPTQLATVIGLLNLELGKIHEEKNNTDKSYFSKKYLSKFVNWIKEIS